MSEPKDKIKLLVVDDTEANRYAVGRVLTKAGFEVIEGASGQDAINLSASRKPDLVILDIHLPDMLGFDVCRVLKSNPTTSSIPVLHLSASYIHPDDKVLGLDSGADAYLVQPVEPLELLATIRALLRARDAEQRVKALNEALEERVIERTMLAEARAEQLRLMAASLSRVEQQERKKIANELHDDLAQLLVVCKMRLSMIRGGSESDKAHIEKLDDFLAQALTYTRTFISELSPMVLHDGGLVAGLNLLVSKMAKNGLNVVIQATEDELKLSEEVLIAGFQGTRELLFNVLKHSGVTKAVIRVETDGKFVYIHVIDEGKGFDVASRGLYPTSEGGFGLFNIKERLMLLGGSFELDSSADEGTRATLTLPVSQRLPSEDEVEPIYKGEASAAATSGTKLRVMIVDDHEIMRDGLRRILTDCGDIEVVMEAVNGRDAIEKARTTMPDVIMMDINMPVMNGVEATRHIVNENPSVKIIGLSVHNDDVMADSIRKAGAKAYLSKDSPCGMLRDVIRKVAGVKTAAGMDA